MLIRSVPWVLRVVDDEVPTRSRPQSVGSPQELPSTTGESWLNSFHRGAWRVCSCLLDVLTH